MSSTGPNWVASISLGHAWVPLLAYLLGSIPFGFLIVKLGQGRDIRQAGSGNIGAANVTREVGTSAGVATLLLDAAKGFAAVWIAARYTEHDLTWMVVAAIGAMLGHMFPLWLRFRGGRGVATGAGVFLPICWPAVAGALTIWAIVLGFWRYVSLASMAAAASLPLLVYLLYAPGHAPSRALSLGTSLAAILIIAKHRPNIERLLSGSEPKFELRHK